MTGGRGIAVRCALILVACVLMACSSSPSSSSSPSTPAGSPASSVDTAPGRVVQVAAAENFWGSIASQLAGVRGHVVSIITNPNTDPHTYEPTAGDARTLAEAQLVIQNGIGYDPWVPKLLAADQGSKVSLDVGAVLSLPDGANPHRWYNPTDVQAVIRMMVSDYQALDPRDRAYFSQRAAAFNTVALGPYDAAIASIKAKYSGTPVGASESIFSMLAPALGLRLITPPSFLKAISEGTDVSVANKETIDNQIRHHLITIYVYNSQNQTPDIQTQVREASGEHIPVATITETLQPAGSTYEAWQTKQLLSIESALRRADG